MKGWFGWNLFKNWVLLNLTPTSTQLSATPSVLLEPKYRILIGQFPQFQAENFKFVRFDLTLAHMISWRYWFRIRTYFWNSDPKIHFWANLGRKSQSCPFCLKTGTYGVSSMLILIPTLVFWVCNPKSTFGSKNSKLSVLLENWHTWYLWRADSESGLRFSKFWP